MDNRIANDMISSGMIPSGEKKKEDLSRTQYGSAPSPSKLMDAYKSMYGNKEEVINEHHKKDADGNTIPHEGEEIKEEPISLSLAALGKVAAIAGKKAVAGMAAKGAGKAGLKATAMAFKNPTAGNVGKVAGQALKGAAKDPVIQQQVVGGAVNQMNQPKEKVNKSGMVTAGADLFDIVKGKLLDEGLSEEEIKDIMLTLTPDEILKEIEESSMSDGSAGGAYQDLGPQGGFRSREQINRMHNDPKGTEKYGKNLMKRVGQAVRDTGTPTLRKVDESKK